MPGKQPFVKTVFEVGEWDPETRTNPLYRPKFNTQSSARIISADDFARRPPVGFTGEFANFEEAMVTLTWMTHKQQKEIYTFYTQMLLEAEQENRKTSAGSSHKPATSHEYVIRVLAQKYKVTSERIAAVIQLQHNEEQLIETGGHVDPELAEYVDTMTLQEITDAYDSQRKSASHRATPSRQAPTMYMEDPVGVAGPTDDKAFVSVSDLHVVGDEEAKENERARRVIDAYRYTEDVDPSKVAAPIDKDCKRLLEQHRKITPLDQDPIVVQQREQNNAKEPAWPQPTVEPRRPRWNYICQTTTNRMENNNPRNTLVEQDGDLKVATVAQAQSVAWKAKRNDTEHMYADVKQAWLDRVNGNTKHVWGISKKKPVALVKKEEKAAAAGDKQKSAQEGSNAEEDEATEPKGSEEPKESEAGEESKESEDVDK